MKVVENSPQNARNCTIFQKFLGGMPTNTPKIDSHSHCSRHACIPKICKVPPPPGEILHTPGPVLSHLFFFFFFMI